ncbi:hypothetical protein HDU98_008565 [Podochytrium sp. JEL0797]|nr:hypothetical protein HDU98_008565 [Podochytrium sp. JEL0797]
MTDEKMFSANDTFECPVHHAPIPPERFLQSLLLSYAHTNPLFSFTNLDTDDDNDDSKWLVGWATAGFFALMAILISATLIVLHLRNWTRPTLQRHIVRILFMVPSYAFCAFVSYRFPDAAIYINLYRDVYEGFAVYSFFNLCLLYLGHTWGEQRESMQCSGGSSVRRFPPPWCCFHYDPKNPRFLTYCKLGICQLVLTRLFSSSFTIYLSHINRFCPDSFSPRYGHFWAILFNLTGMGLAMFSLLTFYLAVHHDLPPGRPIYQFMAIKFVLFVGYVQGAVLVVLVAQGRVKGNERWEVGEVVNAIMSFLTCFEMCGAAVMNCWAFSWREFRGVRGAVGAGVHGDGVAVATPVSPRRRRVSAGVYGTIEGEGVGPAAMRLSMWDALVDVVKPDDLWEDAVLIWGLVLSLVGWRKETVLFDVRGYDDEDYAATLSAREGDALLGQSGGRGALST